MDQELTSTANSTLAMGEALTTLHEHLRTNADHNGLRLLTEAEKLMKGRSLVMSDLDTCTALNFAAAGYVNEVPTDEEREHYREMIRLGEHVS